ncbi:MAG: response regulator [Spirosomataceae bacterium]
MSPLTTFLVPLSGRTHDSKPVLLIVEDNRDLRSYIRQQFESYYQVIEAKDGQEGIEKAIEFVPDLVICDLMMPRLDGFSFCKMLKFNEITSHIPVVMLTAKASN